MCIATCSSNAGQQEENPATVPNALPATNALEWHRTQNPHLNELPSDDLAAAPLIRNPGRSSTPDLASVTGATEAIEEPSSASQRRTTPEVDGFDPFRDGLATEDPVFDPPISARSTNSGSAVERLLASVQPETRPSSLEPSFTTEDKLQIAIVYVGGVALFFVAALAFRYVNLAFRYVKRHRHTPQFRQQVARLVLSVPLSGGITLLVAFTGAFTRTPSARYIRYARSSGHPYFDSGDAFVFFFSMVPIIWLTWTLSRWALHTLRTPDDAK
jgi:hypothetical protein